jgi:hypothetical protein
VMVLTVNSCHDSLVLEHGCKDNRILVLPFVSRVSIRGNATLRSLKGSSEMEGPSAICPVAYVFW